MTNITPHRMMNYAFKAPSAHIHPTVLSVGRDIDSSDKEGSEYPEN